MTLYYRRQCDATTSDYPAGQERDIIISEVGKSNPVATGVFTIQEDKSGNAFGYQTFALDPGNYVIWAKGGTVRLNAIRFVTSQRFAVEPSAVSVKPGGTAEVNMIISGYDDYSASNVTWSVEEQYKEKVSVVNKPGENKATVNVSSAATDIVGHVVTATATLGDAEVTAELKITILSDDPDALVPVYEGTTWTFESAALDPVSSPFPTTKFIDSNNNMKLYYNAADDFSLKNKLVNVKDGTVSKGLSIKGGFKNSFGFTDTGEFNNNPPNRIVEILPGVDGTVTVYAGHTNSSATRALKIRQKGSATDEELSLPAGGSPSITIKVENGKSVYFYSGDSEIVLYAIYFEPAPEFGNTSYDSGYYYKDGDESDEANKRGVIRFFQGFTGKNVEDYGFVFIKDNADTTNYYSNEISGGEKDFSAEGLEGFYGTVKDIVINSEETIYAKAFVTINGVTFFGEKIDGKVSGTSDYVNEPVE